MPNDFGKFIRLMGSPNDHEALAAVRALGRKLQGEGMSWHDLADRVEAKSLSDLLHDEMRWGDPGWP